MKIRLSGADDLVRAWAAELEREYAVRASIYPSRRGTGELRAYIDIDDRVAQEIVQRRAGASGQEPAVKRVAKA